MNRVSLTDKYSLEEGRIFISGTQALVRLPLVQRRRDAARGLDTAGFISGYRGSPLGAYDTELNRARAFLDSHQIHFRPGVNEDLAATSVWGTQQTELHPGARHDGVFAIWYGKGPGVDRSGDPFKHGAMAGTSRHGGVLVLAGDDHGAKSSTVAHQSEYALVASFLPILNPANVQDILDYGLYGFAMSRFSGAWVAMKLVNETLLATATVDAGDARTPIVVPGDVEIPEGGLNIDQRFRQMERERRLIRHRLPAAQAFVRANGLDKTIWMGTKRRLGVITAGKAYADTRQAFTALGIDEARAASLGVGLYKLALTWPVEPEGLARFAGGFDEILVIEEKRPFIEDQAARILYNLDPARRPRLTGKADEQGAPLLPSDDILDAATVAAAIGARLTALGLCDGGLVARMEALAARRREAYRPRLVRAPYFCSGCPHSTSTRVPEGSIAFSGIGCHTLANYMPDRRTFPPTQMGGEGANWIGMAPFTAIPHVFQNMGDGTYHHSGLASIRAAVAAGVNITFKILFNDAVAMTGGQHVDGEQTVPGITRQVAAEGVAGVAVVADEPAKYPLNAGFAPGATVHHRDELDAVQRRLREVPGVTVLVYDQTCAAEKRRRRRRGLLEDPDKRVFINDLVCEGCGDCNTRSNCVSVEPLETEFGRKRAINQSACNKDFSCLLGFCPSFVTVHGGQLRRRARADADSLMPQALPEPARPTLSAPTTILIGGVGGAGVVTLGAVLGMAAHIDGLASSVFDMTGLAQKNGAVLSHLHIARDPREIEGVRIGDGAADLALGCDLVVAASPESMVAMAKGRARAVLNSHLAPTSAFQQDFGIAFEPEAILDEIRAALGEERTDAIDATQITSRLFGDNSGAYVFLAGYAYQRGFLPMSAGAIEEALRLNGVAGEANIRAFRFGRSAAAEPGRIEAALGLREESPREETLDALISRRVSFLAAYQDQAYAERYRAVVAFARDAESARAPGLSEFAEAVTRGLFKLMAYKDEYEVARLYLDPAFKDKLDAAFEGDFTLKVHLAPPLFAARDPASGLPLKSPYGQWVFPAFRLLARLKGLRGTRFDIFGYSEERRAERALIAEYEADVRTLAAALSPESHALAVEIARLPETIRGFGHLKTASIEHAKARRAELLAGLRLGPLAA